MKPSIDTVCVHGAIDPNNATGAIAVPIYQSATFQHENIGDDTYSYSRLQNPTREALEHTVAALEGGVDAIAFTSGMAAFSLLCELFAPGDHLIATKDLYGGSVRYINNIASKNNVSVTFVDTSDLSAIQSAIKPNTKAVFVESPSNPMMLVTDLSAVGVVCRSNNLLFIVDNTFFTPIYQHPFEHGANIILHSGTKYLGGHNDTLAGFLVFNDTETLERCRFLYKTTGACLSPFDAFLLLRGIKTLYIRMERITHNAKRIFEYLNTNKHVAQTYYAGKSGMISFVVDSKETARSVLTRVRTILYAESLGGVETLLTYPFLQTHADVPEDVRQSLGITDRLLRLSVGIENPDDIIADLVNAFGGGNI